MAQLKSTNILGNLAVTGNAVASEFKKLGGTSAQFLKADGSVDIRDYIPITNFTEGASDDGTTMLDLYNKITPQIGNGSWTFVTISGLRNFMGLLSIANLGGYYKIQAIDILSLRTLDAGGTASEITVQDFITGGSTLPGSWSQPGTVTSVGLSVPTGFSISNSPVTDSGTLSLSFTNGYSLPTTAKQNNWDTAYGWGNHANANYVTQNTEQVITAKKTFSSTGSTQKVEVSNAKVRLADNANGFDLQYDSSTESLTFVFN